MKLAAVFTSLCAALFIGPTAEGRTWLNGTAIVNGCSGAVFIMKGMKATQKALLITNGHCIRYGVLIDSPAFPFIPPSLAVYDLSGERLSEHTSVMLHSERGSYGAQAEKLIFATMSETNLAIYQLQETYEELKSRYELEPLLADPAAFQAGENILVHAGRFNRTQECTVSGRTSLREGSYKTSSALRLSRPCEIYSGFFGSPLLRVGTRGFAGLASAYFEGSGEPCSFSNPCEYDEKTGESFPNEKGRSYGVPTGTLYLCYDERNAKLDFQKESCPYREPYRR